MPDPIHAEDGSPLREESQTERPFTHPMAAHQEDPETEGGMEIDPRMALIEEMAAKNDEERQAPEGAVLNGMIPEVPEGYEPTEDVIITPIEEETPAEESLPEQYANDPMAEFIVMDGDKPMFRTQYQGEERLIPLENAHREIQKNVAADIRLQQNTEWQRNLEEREEQLRQQSAALNERLNTMHQSPPSTPEADVDDVDLDAEAREVVSGLFTGSEEEAAAKEAGQPALFEF